MVDKTTLRVDAPNGMNGTFAVRTIDGEEYKPTIASSYQREFNRHAPSFLTVYIDDDFKDGEIEHRTFNLDHVINYGWER